LKTASNVREEVEDRKKKDGSFKDIGGGGRGIKRGK